MSISSKEEIIRLLPDNIRWMLLNDLDFNSINEIRIRAKLPVVILYRGTEYFLSKLGGITQDINNSYSITKEDVTEMLEYISNYSMYAYEEEIRQGFITVHGGHRVGVAGKIVLEENRIKTMKHISYINIRVAHEIKGCANKIFPYIVSRENNLVYNTLIISPPVCGKTTLLRDIVRQLSNGNDLINGMNVSVVDERSEIGACYMGIAQNSVGIRTDILDCCPKSQGMMMVIRSMSPRVIAVDEIGSKEDIEAIEYAINCGCKLIATVHGSSIEQIRKKPLFDKLWESTMFERYIVMDNKRGYGNIKGIYDYEGNRLC